MIMRNRERERGNPRESTKGEHVNSRRSRFAQSERESKEKRSMISVYRPGVIINKY